jgi:cell division septum initiation protein DivIVA
LRGWLPMADQRYRALTRIPYARAIAVLTGHARTSTDDFVFGPMRLARMENHGLTVSGEPDVVEKINELLRREVPGLFPVEELGCEKPPTWVADCLRTRAGEGPGGGQEAWGGAARPFTGAADPTLEGLADVSNVVTAEQNGTTGGAAMSVLAHAQEQADRLLADARNQAQETIKEAQDQRAAVLLETEHDCAAMKDAAEQEAKRIRGAAEADAAQQMALALREGMKAASELPAAVMAEAEVHRATVAQVRAYLEQFNTISRNLLKEVDKTTTEAVARTRAAQGRTEPVQESPSKE